MYIKVSYSYVGHFYAHLSSFSLGWMYPRLPTPVWRHSENFLLLLLGQSLLGGHSTLASANSRDWSSTRLDCELCHLREVIFLICHLLLHLFGGLCRSDFISTTLDAFVARGGFSRQVDNLGNLVLLSYSRDFLALASLIGLIFRSDIDIVLIVNNRNLL